jgi:hypothetical protein
MISSSDSISKSKKRKVEQSLDVEQLNNFNYRRIKGEKVDFDMS